MAPRTKKAAPRSDGWVNVYTALGAVDRDKRLGARFALDTLDEETAEQLWLGDDICARIVEAQPEAELRQGFELVVSDASPAPAPLPPQRIDGRRLRLVRGDDDAQGSARPAKQAQAPQPDNGQELAQALMGRFDELDVTATLMRARQYARAYGGGAVLVGAEDGQTWDQPLDERRIKTVRWLKVLRPRECWPSRYYRTPDSAKFGEVSHYRVQRETLGGGTSQTLEVHESRLVVFLGVTVSTRQRARKRSFGDSVLLRCLERVMDFQAAFQASGILVQDFAQAVFKMKGLAQLLMDGDDDVVVKRAKLIDLSRSVARALMIDADGEEFERKATPLSGLPELLDRLCNRLAAAARMPVTLLMGQAPAGLQATGASDVRNWYDTVAGERERELRPRHNRILRLIMLAADSPTHGREPKSWKVKYPPLWQMTEQETADLRNKQAQTDAVYVNAQVLSPEEVAVARFGGDEWSMETQLDEAAREATVEVASVPFNGIQVEAAQGILMAIAAGQLPNETGAKMLEQFFGFTEEVAQSLVEDIKAGSVTPESVMGQAPVPPKGKLPPKQPGQPPQGKPGADKVPQPAKRAGET